MSDVIDDLKVQIDASTQNADAKLDKFIDKMMRLQSTITGLEMSNVSNIASGINQISSSIQGFNERTKTADFTKVATGLNKLTGIDVQGLSTTSRAISSFVGNMTGLKDISFDATRITGIADSIAKLGRISVTEATQNLEFLKTSLADFVIGMNNVGALTFNPDTLTDLVKSVSKLGGTNATQSVKNLPQICTYLRQFVESMNGIGSVTFNTQGLTALVNNISHLGGIKATQAAANLKPIKDQILRFVSGLNGIGALNFDTTNLTNLVSSITKLGGKAAGNSIGNIQQLGVALKGMMKTLSTAPAVSQNLIQMTNALAALASSGNRVSSASSAMYRGLNLYSSGAKKAQVSSHGLASAIGKVYATYWMVFRAFGMFGKTINIASDLTEVQNVIDVSFGNMAGMVDKFTSNSIQKFGMSELAAKKMSGVFMAMGRSLGGSQSEIADMSIELTKLAADMSSFYNASQEDVGEDLRSVFTGMVRPLRDYGIDLTQANLQQYALAQGIRKPVAAMSQLEKVQLRYNYVMQQTAGIQGDYQRTAGTWANQVRLLCQQFQKLGAIVGGTLINAFKPFLTAMNAVISKVIAVAKAISDALGKIFGWTFEASGGGAGTAGIVGDLEDAAGAADNLGGGAGGAADKLGDAADNAKKLAGNLQAFDDLNIVSSPNESGGSGGGAGGADAGNYGEWVKGESILEAYKSDIDSLFELGEYIGNALTNAMNNIDWDKIYEKARGFGKGLADFLNGLISPQLFDATGQTIAGALNTAFYFLNSFGETFDWKDFGNSIAAGINGFFKKFDFKLLANTFNVWAKGILDTMIAAVSETRWYRIGKQIGIFLAGIDFAEIGSKIGILIWKAINAGIDLWNGMFSAAPIETTLLSVIAALKISSITIMGIDSARKALEGVKIGLSNIAKSAVAHPIALIGGALITLGVGLYNMEKNWKKEMADQFVDFQERIGSAAPKMQESADALHDMAEGAGEILSSANEDVKKLGDLADAYYKLADKTSLTKKEQEKLKEYSQKLIDQCPLLKGAIDEVTGRYTVQKSEIEKLIKAQQEYKRMAAYEEIIGQYETAQQKANVQMEMANIQYGNNENAINRLVDAREAYIASGKDENVWAKENKGLLEELGIAYEEGNFDIAELSKQISFYEKENQELVTSQKDLQKEVNKSNKELESAKTAYENHKNAADEATKSSVAFQQALSNLQTDLSNMSINLTEGFIENLVMNGYDSSGLVEFFASLEEGTATSAESLKAMFSDLGLVLPDQIAMALESKDATVQASVSKTLLSISSGVQATEPDLIKLFNDLGIKLPDSLTKNLAAKEAPLQKTTVDLLSMLENGYNLESGNLLVLFENLGLNVPNELISSLKSKDAETQQAAIELLAQIANGYDGSAPELLKEFENLGLDLPANLKTALESGNKDVNDQAIELLTQILNAEEAERPELIRRLDALGVDASGSLNTGLDSNNKTIRDTSETMVKNVKEPVENEFKSTTSGALYDAGANASKGFWQGMKDWWDDSWLGRKMNALKETVTGVLEINSPSRVMKEYGAYTGIGFNMGFADEMDKTVPMTERWMDSIRATFDSYSIALPGSGISYSFDTPMLQTIESSMSLQTPTDLATSFGMDVNTNITASLKDANSEIILELRRQNELLQIIANKPVIDKGDVVDAWKSGAKAFRKETGKQLGIAY